MAHQLTIDPWTLDRDGRELRKGDRVALVGSTERTTKARGTVTGFVQTWTDDRTGAVSSHNAHTYIRWDRWANDSRECGYWLRRVAIDCVGLPVDVEARQAMEDRPRAIVGDVVGVLATGPTDLQGRTGEVDMIAVRPLDPGQWDHSQVVVLHVLADDNRHGWVNVDDVTVLYPTPEPMFVGGGDPGVTS